MANINERLLITSCVIAARHLSLPFQKEFCSSSHLHTQSSLSDSFLALKSAGQGHAYYTCSISGNKSLRRSSSIGLIFSKTSKIHVKYSCFSSIPSFNEQRKVTLITLKQNQLAFKKGHCNSYSYA